MSNMSKNRRMVKFLMRLHDRINRFLLFLKKNQRVSTVNYSLVKINLGSGLKVAPGWINIDGHLQYFLSRSPTAILRLLYKLTQNQKQSYSINEYISILKSNRFVYHNLKYGIPFCDCTADYIYCSHFLEHMYRDDAIKFVSEIYRVLKPGGILRICIPNLAYVFSLYNLGHKERALSYLFEFSETDEYTYHRYMYDFELLKKLLQEAGFQKIDKQTYRKGAMLDIQNLDNRPDETLYVEAYK